MSEKNEQSAERCVHGVKLINVCTECLQQRFPQLLKPVEQPAASPAQLSAREFYEKHWPHCVGYPDCDGDLEGMAHNPGCPLFQKGNKELFRLASRFSFAEAYRDASQRQPSEQEHCKDCCCAQSWKALEITEYTGKSIPEHITELRTALARAEEQIKERNAMYEGMLERADARAEARQQIAEKDKEIERLKTERDDLQAAFNKGFETHRTAKESR